MTEEVGHTQKVGVMRDHEGNPSVLRWMSLISLLAAIGLAFKQIAHPDWTDDPSFVLMFLLGAFAPKVFQSFVERKFGNGRTPKS